MWKGNNNVILIRYNCVFVSYIQILIKKLIIYFFDKDVSSISNRMIRRVTLSNDNFN